ncbi:MULTISPECIES: galactose-1-phosphate uridylyltransferase [Kitasatospora]|uniref:Galactose-1-phosphate uridylyltransferase n=1 Tax=Kitasatospora setae (strain ATCC 33774 / DSM 43861 / JCM 3304 / KCC A-0304 / NBRC 14216 / KM-6054) TaxID=452652 RepID=E4N120_KITSK|nr:galactose-1-phosphate uridylyltransferase [Kitasatospora setae]BAJ31854.1 putative galactose-1-phosphate uridylyltransferase [Kitasatospora setae KM-6054]
MHKTVTKLADGRELIYYDAGPTPRDAADRRPLEPAASASEIRTDPFTGDAVTIAAHRQSRTYHPPADQCPLCPSTGDRLSEIPDADYQVAVFENRFPSLADSSAAHVTALADGPYALTPGTGRCEVVCFTSDHRASFADLDEARARLVLDAWTDRTGELHADPAVRQVYCFENRGADIGVTLGHPHGQIYAFPFTTPRTALALDRAAAHLAATGRNLYDDVLAAERATAGRPDSRVVTAAEHWTAFVPFAARWPYEVHLYPNRRTADLTTLDDDARAEFPRVYLDLLRRFDRLFPAPAPYIAAWHQTPRPARTELALHLELFTLRRTADKLKYLAGTESGVGAFMNDIRPETAARTLREL